MKRILITAGCILICLWFTGKFLDARYKKFWQPFFDKLDIIFKDNTNYDGIYLGDSRAHFGINPYYIDSVTHLKTYNAGMGGASVNEIYFLAEAYLANHPAPKFAVISIGYVDILQSYRYFENPCYYFFYTDSKLTSKALQDLHYHTMLFKLLPILKYTAFDDFNKVSIIRNLKGESILKPGGVAYNGFINNTTNFFNTDQMAHSMLKDSVYQPGIDKCRQLVQLLKKNNCLPIFVYPPALHFINTTKHAAIFAKIDSAIAGLASTYNVPVLHYDTDTTFTPALFSDEWHVNIQGTVIYSEKLGVALNDLLTRIR